MNITVFTVDGKQYSNLDLCEINFSQACSVACDSLYFYFKSDEFIEEIDRVVAYNGDSLVFNGYCDCQKRYDTKNGYENYIYARSCASRLVDNEALPFTYNCPTATQLWYTLARDRGFKNGLPQVSSSDKYEITKGTSCFGAIRNFVELKTGKIMYVSPEKELKCFEPSDSVKSLNDYKVLSCVSIINRSEPLSRICIKKTADDTSYSFGMKAQLSDALKIDRAQYINLQALPQWQKETSVQNRLKASWDSYKVLEIKVSGFVEDRLFQRFSYASRGAVYDDYILTEKRYTASKNAEVTRLTLKKQMDVKEISYVD